MFCWRVTKYNPAYRIPHGAYKKNEWTSFSDIGTTYDGAPFTFQQYIAIENAYIKAIKNIMACTQTSIFSLTHLHKQEQIQHPEYYSSEMINIFSQLTDNREVNQNLVPVVARLVLREDTWCKLEAPHMYIHFGYDYYLYLGSTQPCKEAVSSIEKSGLFVEPCQSPYK